MSADLGNVSVISPVDANNGSGTMPSFLGSAAPSTLDDASRALQGAIAREWENRSYPTATGTAPSFVVTYTVAPAALRSGQTYTFTAHAAAVGTDTLNANALGAKGIKKVVAGVKTATAANDFYTGDKISCVYDGTDMVWDNRGTSEVAASTTVSGIVELATTTETLTGTDATRAATPDSVAALWEAGADIADGAAITIGEGGYFNLITSTTAITSFSITTNKTGRTFRVRFNTARTLTHNATSLIIPGGSNITTAQGDIAQIRSLGSGNVVVEWYTKADGTALVAASATAASQAEQEAGSSTTVFTTPGRQHFHPSAAKVWGKTLGSTVPVLTVSFNMTSITDAGVGRLTCTIATDFSTSDYAIAATMLSGSNQLTATILASSVAAGSFEIRSYETATLTDPGSAAAGYSWSCFGDQA